MLLIWIYTPWVEYFGFLLGYITLSTVGLCFRRNCSCVDHKALLRPISSTKDMLRLTIRKINIYYMGEACILESVRFIEFALAI